MENPISEKLRKTLVIINYMGLFLILGGFEFRIEFSNYLFQSLMAAGILMLSISFYLVYYKTGIWSFSHKPFKLLDEREVQVSANATRFAYAIFTVTMLVLVYLYALAEMSFSVVFAACMIYFAHIIPASVIAWVQGRT